MVKRFKIHIFLYISRTVSVNEYKSDIRIDIKK